MNSFVDYVIRTGGTDDWKQTGASFLCDTVDRGGSAAEALHALSAVLAAGVKLTIPVHAADGRLAARHVDLGHREATDAALGALYALGWREGHAAGIRGDGATPRSRPIGFTPRH